MKRFKGWLADGYVSAVTRGDLRRLNRKLLNVALRAEGFNNYRSHAESGEQYFQDAILRPSDPKVAFDVGANKGDYTKGLLALTGANVFAFEPLPEPFKELEGLAKTSSNRLTAINKGVSDKIDILQIHFDPERSTHASFAPEVQSVDYVNPTNTLDIPVTTLDEFVRENAIDRLDFVKIDTEGFEYEVLRGAHSAIAGLKPKYIQLEYNWHQLFRGQSIFSLSELLPEYRAFQLLPGAWIERDPKDPVSNFYAYSNFVFVRNG